LQTIVLLLVEILLSRTPRHWEQGGKLWGANLVFKPQEHTLLTSPHKVRSRWISGRSLPTDHCVHRRQPTAHRWYHYAPWHSSRLWWGTLENIIVLTCLRLIHVDFPHLVKQRYGTELRTRTLASIKPEISQALESLLDEGYDKWGIRLQVGINTVSVASSVKNLGVYFDTSLTMERSKCNIQSVN